MLGLETPHAPRCRRAPNGEIGNCISNRRGGFLYDFAERHRGRSLRIVGAVDSAARRILMQFRGTILRLFPTNRRGRTIRRPLQIQMRRVLHTLFLRLQIGVCRARQQFFCVRNGIGDGHFGGFQCNRRRKPRCRRIKIGCNIA